MNDTLTQSQLYERAFSLHSEAHQRYSAALAIVNSKVLYKEKSDSGPEADREWLQTTVTVAGQLYDRAISVSATVEFLGACAHELETLPPVFIGARAEEVTKMTRRVRNGEARLKAELAKLMQSADDWQRRANEWEHLLRTEGARMREERWIREDWEQEEAEIMKDYEDWLEASGVPMEDD